jgi:predicted nucleotidyltransferase
MSISSQTYKELAIPYFKEVFDIIDEVMIKMKCPYYLIGVSAIALRIAQMGEKPPRGTKDIDFAVMVSSFKEYDEILQHLTSKGFTKTESTWTLYHKKYDVVIDLMPFGEIEEPYTIDFKERQSELHVLGFKEVLGHPEHLQIEDKQVLIPPFPGMLLLKLIAWNDRPEKRKDDLSDILRIIEYYYELIEDEILEVHNDTFVDAEAFDKWLISAEVLGKKAITYLSQSAPLKETVFAILKKNINNKEQSPILKSWGKHNDWGIDYAEKILQALIKGMKISENIIDDTTLQNNQTDN